MNGLGLSNKGGGGYVESPPNNPSQDRDVVTGQHEKPFLTFEDRALNPVFPSTGLGR